MSEQEQQATSEGGIGQSASTGGLGISASEEKQCDHSYKCTYEGMDGERYRCTKCGDTYYLDYDEIR